MDALNTMTENISTYNTNKMSEWKELLFRNSENDLKHGFRDYFGKMNESTLT